MLKVTSIPAEQQRSNRQEQGSPLGKKPCRGKTQAKEADDTRTAELKEANKLLAEK